MAIAEGHTGQYFPVPGAVASWQRTALDQGAILGPSLVVDATGPVRLSYAVIGSLKYSE
jgi:hypothetical protein